jgi:acyl homoserine lactone synthase
MQALALRAATYCRELRWVGTEHDAIEVDQYDPHATAIGVMDESGGMVGTVRIHGPEAPWMLNTVFARLLPEETGIAKAPDCAEASRLAVHRRFRNRRIGSNKLVADLVYKGAFVFCMLHGFRYLYVVVSRRALRHLRARAIPCRPLGPPVRMPDGVETVAARVDWGELLAAGPQELVSWMQDVRADEAEGLSRPRGLGLPPLAF